MDWWSLGVLTYELLTGASPFTVEGERNQQSDISKRILNARPPMNSPYFTEGAKSFIQSLLVVDPPKRLGAINFQDLKNHYFFKGLNWEDLAAKRIPAPFKPKIVGETDTSNFSEEFTSQPAAYSPDIAPVDTDRVFKGYSYVAPSVLFSENHAMSDLLMPASAERRPNDKNICLANRFGSSIFFQKYEINLSEEILGDGTYSVCRKCKNKQTGREYAVKIVSKRFDTSREVELLKLCQGHPNIVKLIEVYHDQLHTYIVLEFLRGGELLHRIRKRKSFTEQEASDIMRKLISAVQYIHERGVVHRDLKPENLLYESDREDAEVKIVDFGFARVKPQNGGMTTPCFTLHYAAPEVLKRATEKSGAYDESCDLWSLGVILYTMLSGRAPFQSRSRDNSASSIMEKITGGEFSIRGAEWSKVSRTAKHLIQGLLTVNPKHRLTMEDLRKNKWINSRSTSNRPKPLSTPNVLVNGDKIETVRTQITATMDAFHKAHEAGFRLQDVTFARLAQRRAAKKSSSTDSSLSSQSSSSNGTTAASIKSSSSSSTSSSLASLGFTPTSQPSVFSFKESQIASLSRTLTPPISTQKRQFEEEDNDDVVVIEQPVQQRSNKRQKRGDTIVLD